MHRIRNPESLTLSPREAAAFTGLGVRVIYEDVESGLLPAIRTGRLWRVLRARIPDYLDAKSSPEKTASR